MTMKVAILTTDTTHHTYFVKELEKCFPIACVVLETRVAKASFETFHPFEQKRDVFEKKAWFAGEKQRLSERPDVIIAETINDDIVEQTLRSLAPDVIIVFGTRKISQRIISCCPNGIINLHGGDPERYRGLDSHLWAIYHDDFSALITTIHRLNETLDDGQIIAQEKLILTSETSLSSLRKLNTEACVKLAICALDMFERWGTFLSRPQKNIGRYYSFMPTELKELCLQKFEHFVEQVE